MAEQNQQQVNETPATENENVQNAPVEQNAEQTPQKEVKTYDFAQGDIITDGENELGVYDRQSDDYIYLYLQGCMYNNKIKHVYLDTLSAKDGKDWRKATEIEKKFFAGQLSDIASKMHL